MADIAEIGFKVDSTPLKKAVGDLEQLSVSATSVSFSLGKMETATRKTTAQMATETVELNKNTVAQNKNTAAVERGTKTRGKARRLERAVTGVDPLTGKMVRDLGVNRFNTANIAAQFQDIGVTAAMGMNPLTIALQQGTQLSAILNNMGNPLKGLAQAFTQLINPVALVSIALTGLIAALVQMVDWSKVWETANGLLVKGLQFLKENIDLVVSALSILIGIGIITHLGAITTAVTSTALAFGKLLLVMALPVSAIVVGVTAIAYGFYKLRKAMGDINDFNFLSDLKNGINMMISMFVNGLKVIRNAFRIFWNDLKGMAADFVKAIIDVGEKTEKIFSSIGSVFDQGKYLSKRIKEYEGMKKAIDQELGVDRRLMGKNRLDYFTEGVEDLTQPTDYIGKLKPAVEKALDWSIDKLTSKTEELDKKLNEAWDKIVKTVEGHKIEMAQEAGLLGRIGEDYYITKEKYDLLNQAREAGITLTKEQLKYIEDESISLGQQADALNKLTERFEFAKSTTNSFFTDMNHALREGKTLWEAFGDAVMNVLGKILDKMTSVGVDMMFAGGQKSNWFGIGENFGHGVQVYNSTSEVGPFLPQALGGAWNRGVQKFATGGIVGSPTLFGARNGVGLMGEAGPEAIMPLTRGANGELGVKADGVGGSSVVVNVINNSNSKATVNQRQTQQGTEIDVVIDQLVADKLGTIGSASNTAMNTWNNRQLIAR